jgi:hypothetical protein
MRSLSLVGPSSGRIVFRRIPLAVGVAVGALFVLVASLGSIPRAEASPPANSSLQATTSREARESAIRSIPYDKMDPAGRASVDSILANISIYRRLPVRVTDCDPELYLFLLRHPDVVVNIWEVLGVSQIHVRQVAEGTFRIGDNSGTAGTIRLLCQSQDTHVLYAEGCYEGVLCPRPIRGRCLLIVKSGYVRESDGRWYVTTRLDSFLSLEPGALELLTKTFQPLVGQIADTNFSLTVGFVGSLSHTTEVNPRGVQRLAGKLTHVTPETRQQFADLADRVGKKPIDYPSRTSLHSPAAMASRTETADAR